MNSHLTVLETAILPLNYSPKAIALPIELTRHTSKKTSRKPVCLPLAPFGIYHTITRHFLIKANEFYKWCLKNCCKCLIKWLEMRVPPSRLLGQSQPYYCYTNSQCINTLPSCQIEMAGLARIELATTGRQPVIITT